MSASGPYEAPTGEVLAAILAAVEMAWPRPVVVAPAEAPSAPGPWRFSGRWWAVPSTARRERPWVQRSA